MKYRPAKSDSYAYLVVSPNGVATYVHKKDFEAMDATHGFTRRLVSADGNKIIGFLRKEATPSLRA